MRWWLLSIFEAYKPDVCDCVFAYILLFTPQIYFPLSGFDYSPTYVPKQKSFTE
jgi:hypothetical protein